MDLIELNRTGEKVNTGSYTTQFIFAETELEQCNNEGQVYTRECDGFLFKALLSKRTRVVCGYCS
jgi:hypothetical protein